MEIEEIYRKYFNDVYRYLRRLSGNEALAQDLTSETFFKAMNALHTLKDATTVRVWLCQIAKNEYLSWYRKQKHIDPSEIDFTLIPASDMNIEKQCLDKSEQERLREIVHDLGEPAREVVLWRIYGGLSFKEIGVIFHRSENWACVVYHRSLASIKKKLEDTET